MFLKRLKESNLFSNYSDDIQVLVLTDGEIKPFQFPSDAKSYAKYLKSLGKTVKIKSRPEVSLKGESHKNRDKPMGEKEMALVRSNLL